MTNSEDRCVCCGEIIPEGRMVCPKCEKGEVGMQVGMSGKIVHTKSCEDENTEYITFSDGLRLVFNYGEYVGWYLINAEG